MTMKVSHDDFIGVNDMSEGELRTLARELLDESSRLHVLVHDMLEAVDKFPPPNCVPVVHACKRLPEYVLVTSNDEDDVRYVPERHCSMTNRVLVWHDAVHDEDHKWQAFVCSACGAKTRGINVEYDVLFRPKYCPKCGSRVDWKRSGR